MPAARGNRLNFALMSKTFSLPNYYLIIFGA